MQPNASPFNALPPAVTALAAVIFGGEVLFLLAERCWLRWALEALET